MPGAARMNHVTKALCLRTIQLRKLHYLRPIC